MALNAFPSGIWFTLFPMLIETVAAKSPLQASVRETMHRIVSRLLLLAIVPSLAACTSTDYLRSDYAPRLSARAVTLEAAVKSLPPQPLHVLGFRDRRGENDTLYTDPKLVWKGKGIYEYRFETKTVAEYLREALVFDLARLGFSVTGTTTAATFTGAFPTSGADGGFVLGVEMLECRPDYDSHFASVSPFYVYVYDVKLWDSRKSQTVVDKRIEKRVEGVREPSITFATLSDRLLNDHLSEMNFEVAETLVQAMSKD